MPIKTGILVFDGVDELDFVGPLDVFSYASGWGKDGEVFTVGRHRGSLRGVNGLAFEARYDMGNAPAMDIVIVPGGHGTEALSKDQSAIEWLRERALSARMICSVCTGSFVLQAAGLTEGRRITTHRKMLEQLKAAGPGNVVSGRRFVSDGKIVTAAGVSAGIDMALWVVGQVYGEAHARNVRASLDYDPAPPY